MNAYQHILLATDFSPLSESAARRAKHVAERNNAKLHVLHVVEEVMLYGEDNDMMLDDVDIMLDDTLINNEKMFELAKERMQNLVERVGFTEEVEQVVVWGNPKSTVISWAQEHQTDLIIVGSHGHNAIELFLGSVSNSITNQSVCDVLIVREKSL